MARHRKPTWWMSNRSSISTTGMALVALASIVTTLTGMTPSWGAPAKQPVAVAASNVDTRPLSPFETHHVSISPVVVTQLQTAAQQSPAPVSVTIEPGSSLSQTAAELGSPWTWQSLCAHTNPALTDCNVVMAGTVISLVGPTHPLPIAAPPAPQVVIKPAAVVTHAPAPAPAHTVQVQHPTPAPATYATAPVYPATSHQALMAAAGIASSDFQYVEYIVSHESGWKVNAKNPSSPAYGLPQALPGSKMASAGSDWMTNPVTQLKWANWYAISTYGSWHNAYLHWVNHRWW